MYEVAEESDADSSSKITITGTGATIRRTGGADFRLFALGVGADLTLDRVSVTGGRVSGASDHGGAIEATGTDAKLTLTNATVSKSTAGSTGGGISMRAAYQTLTMTGSTVSGNTAGRRRRRARGQPLHGHHHHEPRHGQPQRRDERDARDGGRRHQRGRRTQA
jgi:hypothetical protein